MQNLSKYISKYNWILQNYVNKNFKQQATSSKNFNKSTVNKHEAFFLLFVRTCSQLSSQQDKIMSLSETFSIQRTCILPKPNQKPFFFFCDVKYRKVMALVKQCTNLVRNYERQKNTLTLQFQTFSMLSSDWHVALSSWLSASSDAKTFTQEPG